MSDRQVSSQRNSSSRGGHIGSDEAQQQLLCRRLLLRRLLLRRLLLRRASSSSAVQAAKSRCASASPWPRLGPSPRPSRRYLRPGSSVRDGKPSECRRASTSARRMASHTYARRHPSGTPRTWPGVSGSGAQPREIFYDFTGHFEAKSAYHTTYRTSLESPH